MFYCTAFPVAALFNSLPVMDLFVVNNIIPLLSEGIYFIDLCIIKLLWSLMSKRSTTFRSIDYGPCSRTGVMCVASDFY